MITKQPLATPYYSINQQFGSYDLFRTSVDATGPLTEDDTLLYRVNASFQDNNSFRELSSVENIFIAPILKWNISPHTQVTLEMEYQHQNSNLDLQALPFDQMRNRVIDDISHRINLGESNPEETENIFVGFNWSHQFNEDWSIKHQVVFKRNDVEEGITFLPFFFDLANRTVDRAVFRGRFVEDTIATIVDLNGHFETWGVEHNVLFGGDYYRQDISDGAASALFPASTISIDNPIHPGSSVPFLAENTNPSNQVIDNYGLYLQDQISLPYDIHIMGGLRYQYVSAKNDSGFGVGGIDGGSTIDDAVTPRFGLLWQPQNWLSLYSNYVENFGVQSGLKGFGGRDASGNELPGIPLRPESAQQWEVGVKAAFFDGRLRATLAYYDLTKKNVASTDNDPTHICGGGGFGSCSIAIGEVRSRGPELDIQGEILPGWNVIGTYTNQDVRITKSNNGDVGNRPQFVPRNVGSLWTTYDVQQGVLKGFKLGGGVNFQDSVVDAANTLKSPGYGLVGLMSSYRFEIGRSKVTAQLNVDNVLDKTYFTNASPLIGSTSSVNFSTPRTFIGSIDVQF